jgi:DNA-binding FadR family transcriptional regulator
VPGISINHVSRSVVEAIASREPAAGGAAMRRHLDSVRSALGALEEEEGT